MGNIRKLKRSVARHPERVWLANQKIQENANKSKQKEVEAEKDSGECGDNVSEDENRGSDSVASGT
jgi:hypothetical protein